MLGVMATRDAQRMADNQGLDLVEVSPNAKPPVCKIMDYGKFRYEESIKRKEQRKSQKVTMIKEIKFHPGVDTNDLGHKLRQMTEFFKAGHKVKVTLQYRGRENAHKDLGMEVIKKVIEATAEYATLEQQPKFFGRTLSCLLAPRPQQQQKPPRPAPAPSPEKEETAGE